MQGTPRPGPSEFRPPPELMDNEEEHREDFISDETKEREQ